MNTADLLTKLEGGYTDTVMTPITKKEEPVVREKIINRIAKEDKPAHKTNSPITSVYKPKGRKAKADKPKKQKPSLRTEGVKVTETNKSLLYGYDNMARSINDFMYTGRPKRSPKKLHTVAEHEEFLAKLLEKCWENYNIGVEELGGKQTYDS